MTKRQIAAAVAAVLSALAGLLMQCPEEPEPRQGVTVGADAGAR